MEGGTQGRLKNLMAENELRAQILNLELAAKEWEDKSHLQAKENQVLVEEVQKYKKQYEDERQLK